MDTGTNSSSRCRATRRHLHSFRRSAVVYAERPIAHAVVLVEAEPDRAVGGTARPLHLAERLLESPIPTVCDAQRPLGASNRAARANVGRLAKADIPRQVGERDYGRIHVAGEVLDALE